MKEKNTYYFFVHFKFPYRDFNSSYQTSGETLMELKEGLNHHNIDISWVSHVQIKTKDTKYRLMTPLEYFKAFGYRE